MQRLHGLTRGVSCLAFSPDGATLAAGYYDGSIRLWAPDTGECRKLASVGNRPNVLAWTPAGKLAMVSAGGAACVYRTDGPAEAFLGNTGGNTGCLSGDGRHLLAASRGSIRRWDLLTRTELPAWPAWCPGHLAASADGTLVAVTHPGIPHHSEDAFSLGLRDATTGDFLFRLDEPVEYHAGVAFSPDGTRLAVLKHQSFWLWELPNRKVIAAHEFEKFNTGLAYSPDGRTIATSNNDGLVRFWDGRTGELLKAYDWKIGKPLCVTFAPDGLRAAAGGSTGQIVIWDAE